MEVNPASDWERAVHECTHVAVMLETVPDVPIESVTIDAHVDPGSGETWAAGVRYARMVTEDLSYLPGLHAGWIGEVVIAGRSKEDAAASSMGDWDRIKSVRFRAGFMANRDYDLRVKRNVRAFVEAHDLAIRSIAEHLLRRRTLSGDEIRKAWSEAPRPPAQDWWSGLVTSG